MERETDKRIADAEISDEELDGVAGGYIVVRATSTGEIEYWIVKDKSGEVYMTVSDKDEAEKLIEKSPLFDPKDFSKRVLTEEEYNRMFKKRQFTIGP